MTSQELMEKQPPSCESKMKRSMAMQQKCNNYNNNNNNNNNNEKITA